MSDLIFCLTIEEAIVEIRLRVYLRLTQKKTLNAAIN